MLTDAYPVSPMPAHDACCGAALTSFREAQCRAARLAAPASSQELEQALPICRVQAGCADGDRLPVRQQSRGYSRPVLSSRAVQALASYTGTANYVGKADARQVLGPDRYT